MNRDFKPVLRPLYSRFIHLPVVRRFIVRAAATLSTEMNVFADFVENGYGEQYTLTKRTRGRLIKSFYQNCRGVQSATSADLHTVLARELLSIPRQVPGDVIACGPFKGASPANLSLLCQITRRRLFVHDPSERGPDGAEEALVAMHPGQRCDSDRDACCGHLKTIAENTRRYGDISVCQFVPHLHSQVLRALSASFVFAFLSVEHVDSMKDCLRSIWPLMAEGGVIYTTDARNMDVVRLYFDDGWWHEALHEPAPGLVGSGCGLPLGPAGSSLSYIRKSRHLDARLGNDPSWTDSLLQMCHD